MSDPLPASVSRRVLSLAWPVLTQQLLILTVSLSDQYLAGDYHPPAGVDPVAVQAGLTTAHYLAWFIASYTVLVSTGSTALVARFVGARDFAGARHVTGQSLLLAVAVGLIGTAVGLTGLRPLVGALGLAGDEAAATGAFLTPLLVLLTFHVVQAAGIACLVGAGDTRTGLMILTGVAIVNLPLAWGFCYGLGPFPERGLSGIALGTAISHVLGAGVVLAVLTRGRAGLRIDWPRLWPDREILRRLLRVSVPAAIDSLSVVIGQLWFLGIVNSLGSVASAAHGIALRWEALGYLSGSAFGTAAMALVGQNLGAQKPDEASRCGWTAFAWGCGVMSLMGVIFFTLAVPMFGLFCPKPDQRPVIDAGVPVLQLVAFAMPGLASCIVFTSALRGAGDTRVPVLITWTGFLGVRIPLAYWLTGDTMGLGLLGAWLAMGADLYVRGVFFLVRFAGRGWQKVQV